MDYMQQLMKWYESQCDGEWEHEFGIVIETLDNPGWIVKIDTTYTELDAIAFERIEIQHSDSSWIQIGMADGHAFGSTEEGMRHFVGMGGVGNLDDIIRHFLMQSGLHNEQCFHK